LPNHQPVLIDCLTLWLTNQMLAEHDVEAECRRLADVLSRPRGPWFVVSNEVGLGIVPDNALARRFRDAAGRLNQQVAAVADSVLMMVAGLPLKVK
jgi:adenosylcobinamide kinase/adenosylcobinamide-phosphate guanylyltransferase